MKKIQSKKLSKKVSTICDFNRGTSEAIFGTTKPQTDPTTVTVTLITTTIQTYKPAKMLS